MTHWCVAATAASVSMLVFYHLFNRITHEEERS